MRLLRSLLLRHHLRLKAIPKNFDILYDVLAVFVLQVTPGSFCQLGNFTSQGSNIIDDSQPSITQSHLMRKSRMASQYAFANWAKVRVARLKLATDILKVMSRTTSVFSVSLPPEMLEDLERVRREQHRTRSELVREALRRYLSVQ
jgi:hypothetical protein